MDNSLRRWTFFPYSPFCLCGNITVFRVFVWDFVSIPAWIHLCQSDSRRRFSALGGSDTCISCQKTKYHPSNDTLKISKIREYLWYALILPRIWQTLCERFLASITSLRQVVIYWEYLKNTKSTDMRKYHNFFIYLISFIIINLSAFFPGILFFIL